MIEILNTKETVENKFYVLVNKNEFEVDKINSRIVNKNENYKILDEIFQGMFNGQITKNSVGMNFPVELLNRIKEYKFPIFAINHIFFEKVMEQHREKNYLDYPSRISSNYVCKELTDLNKLLYKYKWQDRKILEVKINTQQPHKVIKCNMELISYLRVGMEEQMFNPYLANHYWDGIIYPLEYTKGNPYWYVGEPVVHEPIIEYLVEGYLDIIREIELETETQ